MKNPTYDRIRDDQFCQTLVQMVAQATNNTIRLELNPIDCAMLPFSYENRNAGVGCNIGIFEDEICMQIYGFSEEVDWTTRTGDDLGELTAPITLPDAPDRGLVDSLLDLLGWADWEGHEGGYCDGTNLCSWDETHDRGNCDGPEHCRCCRVEDEQFRALVAYAKMDDIHGDPWGVGLGLKFNVADQLLYGLEVNPPEEWLFRSPSGHRGTPVDELPEEITEASEAALVRFGNLLGRYLDRVRKAGRDY